MTDEPIDTDSAFAVAHLWLMEMFTNSSLTEAWKYTHPMLRRRLVLRWSGDAELADRWAAGDLTPPERWAEFGPLVIAGYRERWREWPPERWGAFDRWQPADRPGRALVWFIPEVTEAYVVEKDTPTLAFPFLMAFTPHEGWSVLNPGGRDDEDQS